MAWRGALHFNPSLGQEPANGGLRRLLTAFFRGLIGRKIFGMDWAVQSGRVH